MQLHDAGNKQAVSLLTLLHTILAPYGGENRVRIGGDDSNIGGKAVTYLSLLLHELATNAAKHGSLSVESGRLDIRVVSDGDLVRLIWRETAGPAPSTSGPAGFGSRLERCLTDALNAMIERDWLLTGLVATIAMPRPILTV